MDSWIPVFNRVEQIGMLPQGAILRILFRLLTSISLFVALGISPSFAQPIPTPSIAGGASHACAVNGAGNVQCWGWNELGQLGDGTVVDRYTPVTVSGLTGVIAVAAGYGHTCALTGVGSVYCWGNNYSGQLGDGTTVQRNSPVAVTGLSSGVVAITAGGQHSCALMLSGAAKCWGSNGYGQLGDDMGIDSPTPVDVLNLSSGVTDLKSGDAHTCAVVNGVAKCWGNGFNGRLGNGGSTGPVYSPADVAGLSGTVKAIAAGYMHSCALMATGSVKCWGDNSGWQLGDGTGAGSFTPVDAGGYNNRVAIATMGYNACALGSAGDLPCWGSLPFSSTPLVTAPFASNVLEMTTGQTVICGRTSAGLRCMGDNIHGEVGDGTTADRATPVSVLGLTGGAGRLNQTIGFATLAARPLSGSPFTVSAATSSSLPASFSSTTPSICTVSGSTVTLVAAGTCSISATQAGNSSYNAALTVTRSFSVTNSGTAQTITFAALPARTYGSAAFSVSATATSSLAVSFTSSTPSVCTVSSSTVTLVGAGTCSIAANQAGNATYSPAPTVTQSFAVSPAAQTITFAALPSRTLANSPFTVSATASSGLGVSLASTTSAVCTVSGTTVTLLTAGNCSLTASQTGNANYAAAPPVTQAFSVTSSSLAQTITFTAPASKTYGDAPFTLSATASSGLAVTFTSSTTAVCTVSGTTATIAGAGTCTIAANQAGNATYSAAPQVTQSLTVAKAAQTITFGAPGNKTMDQTGFALSASASSGLAVTFSSSTTGICTVSGTTVSLLATGTCTISANQAGNANYTSGSAVTQSFTVGPARATQTISFAPLPAKGFGDTAFALTATASSGLPVAFTASPAGVCTVSGNTVTIVGLGICTIAANQAGNSSYQPASQVTQAFSVGKGNQSITIAPVSGKTFGNPPFTTTATASSGLPVTLTSTTAATCTVSGTTVTIVAAGTCTLAGNQAGNANYNPAPQATLSFAIAKAAQSISFAALTGRPLDDPPFTVSATASSALAVAFTSTTPSACTASGNTVTLVATGTCSIAANQAGNANYAAATPVTQSFVVAAARQAQTITFPAVATKKMGDPAFPVTATASSGLTVSFSSTTTGVCTVSGSTVNLVAIGTCSVAANQSGNSSYQAAPQVTQSFAVSKGTQSISFPNLLAKTFGDAPFTVAPTASSALPVSLSSSTPTVCSVSGTTVSLSTAGTCTLAASQAGNANYDATSATQSFAVNRALQVITGTLIPPSIGILFPYPATATGGSSGNPIVLSSKTPAVCTTSGMRVGFLAAGTCIIAADQAGNANYQPAQQLVMSGSVTKAPVTITLSLPNKTFGDPPFVVNVTSSIGGTFPLTSLTTTVCTVDPSNRVTLVNTGTCTMTASRPEDTYYQAAQATASFTVLPGAIAPQVITGFAPPASFTYVPGASFPLNATGGGSGNPVVYASETTPVCAVSGNTVSLLSVGICTLTANQAGNAAYAPAAQVKADVSVGVTNMPPTLVTPDLPRAAIRQTYRAKLLIGGMGNSASLTLSGLPDGMSWNYNGTGTLTIVGAPTQAGSFTLSILATNAAGSVNLLSTLQVDNFATNVVSASTGLAHSCAVVDGGVRCWGRNANGQLGDGTLVSKTAPVIAIASGSGVTAVSAGEEHTCAVINAGVSCWGNNGNGQLGNGSITRSTRPVVAIPPGNGATAVHAGIGHTCAVVAGGVRCWGFNGQGQLGNNSVAQSLVPVITLPSGSGVTSISAGGDFSCAVVNAGVKCWGSNSEGQLGNNGTANSLVPVDAIAANSDARMVTTGGRATGFACAVVRDGVKCWGYAGDGQLGYIPYLSLGSNPNRRPQDAVPAGRGATAVSAGFKHVCAILDGGLECWGVNNTGQLGNDKQSNEYSSTTHFSSFANASNVTAVSAGSEQTCAIVNGGLVCWGSPSDGRLGADKSWVAKTPRVAVDTGTNTVGVSTTGSFACASMNGQAKCWGDLGPGAMTVTPADTLATGAPLKNLSSRQLTTCGLLNGGVQCWQRGGAAQNILPEGSRATAVSVGQDHSCAVVNGGVQCWGGNVRGQLGNASTTSSTTPVVAIAAGSGATNVAAGDYYTCAIVAGGVRCWGLNSSGQLGTGNTTQRTVPVSALAAGSGATDIAAGSTRTCAVVSAGMRCWGAGTLSPAISVPNGSDVSAVAQGANHGCSIVKGGVRCWGTNSHGQLGNNSQTNSTTPVQAIPEGSGVTEIATNGNESCAVTAGGVACWGDNTSGQVGDFGTFYYRKVYTALQLIGPPSAPTVTSSTAGPNSVTLNITAPSNNGGSPITEYTATCTAAGRPTVTATAGPTATSITVTGLVGGTAYNCVVTASSGGGVSVASTSTPVTPLVPPTTVSLTAPANGATYTAPATITLTAVPTVSGATVTKVEFFRDTTLIGTVTSSPYTTTWNASQAGTYVLTAKVTDSLGRTATSNSVKVGVSNAGESITYLHSDTAGSPIAATDLVGSILWKEGYQPFGSAVRKEPASTNNRQFFHGKPTDGESGLSYFSARYYDPTLGRFMAFDPAGIRPSDLHTFNRYSYGNNNPYKYTDPDGRISVGMMALIGFAIATAVVLPVADQNLKAKGSGGLATQLQKAFAGIFSSSSEESTNRGHSTSSTMGGATTAASPPPEEPDEDEKYESEKPRGEKGQSFRGGRKADRDKWYGQNNKDFQKWWHREGKSEFNGGRDIQNSQNAKEAIEYWESIGSPKVK